MQTPRTEFAQALKAVATERGLDANVILETIKQAIIAAYRRDARERGEETDDLEFDVELNPSNGEARVFAWPARVVETPEAVAEEGVEADLPEEPEEEKKARLAQKQDVTPPGFGRIAAQTAKQVIHQKIREAEKDAILGEFSERVGNLVSGMILRFDGPNVRIDIGRTEGIMPAEERIPTERLNPNQRLTFLLKDIKETPRGREIILSRAEPSFVEKLFAREVPEIASGSVIVKKVAREAGVRTKIVVSSGQPGVDPVGSCVGQKGVRVQAVTNELGGERVDIIPWSEDMVELIKASLSPAENLSVTLDEENKTAIVYAPEDQLSLVIGKDGQNVRLAAKITGWKIEAIGTPVEKEEQAGQVEEVEQVDGEKEPETGDVNAEKNEKVEPEKEMEKVEKKEKTTEDTQADQQEEHQVNSKALSEADASGSQEDEQ